MKVGLISLGCAKNLVDSEMILSFLKRNDLEIVNDSEQAELVIINTCGFIEASKQESIDTILEYVDTDKIVVVTGCLVERYLDDLQREIPEVDLFLPIKDYFKFDQKLNQVIENRKLEGQLELSKRVITTKPFSAYFLSRFSLSF